MNNSKLLKVNLKSVKLQFSKTTTYYNVFKYLSNITNINQHKSDKLLSHLNHKLSSSSIVQLNVFTKYYIIKIYCLTG